MVMLRDDESAPARAARAFLDGFARNDMDAVASQLAEDMVYEGPMDRFDGRDAFVEDLAKYAQIVRRIEPRQFFVDGDEACVIFTLVTTIAEIERTRMAVWLTVRDDVIVRMEGFLDVRAYERMLQGH